MKNVMVIDEAQNCVYDIFAVTDQEFSLIYPNGEDVAFIDEVYGRGSTDVIDQALSQLWTRRVPKSHAQGIHGLLYYGFSQKKAYYPTRRDEEAANPDGTLLRSRPVA